jgi:type III pantothenate kinase
MINLILDIGNTRTKVALYNHGEMMITFPVEAFTENDLNIILSDYPGIQGAILSSVKEDQSYLINALNERIPFFVELSHLTALPVANNYATPETLGKDRIAAAVGANKLFPNQHVLVIDAGTAITYDFVTGDGVYPGGFITPGLMMRFRALNHFTDKLPLLQPDPPSVIEGSNTINSIKGGIQYGLEGEISRMINFFSNKYGNFPVILTGGDANYFKAIIPEGQVINELTLLGLNAILEFNYSLQTKR